EPIREKVERVESVLESFKAEIPLPAFNTLKNRVREVAEASESEAESIAQQVALLGPLATAGMCALAYEHEVAKQFQILSSVGRRLSRILVSDPAVRQELKSIQDSIENWISRAKTTRALFSHLASAESNDKRRRFKARIITEQVKEQVRILLRGTVV